MSNAAPARKWSETFKVMEHKLLRVIMNPAMIVAWGGVTGLDNGSNAVGSGPGRNLALFQIQSG